MERGRATERAGTGPADGGPGGLAARLYRQAWLMFVLPPLFWSGNFVLGKAVAGHVPPVGLAFWRWTGALLILLVLFGPRLRADLPELRRRWPIVLILAALGIGLYNTLVYIGLGTTSVLNALVLQSSTPVVIVAASVLVYRDRIGLRQAAGIAVSLAGALAIVTRGDPAALLDLRLAIGDALILLLGQLAIQNQLACHLLRQESRSMLRFLFQTIVGRLSFLICQNVGSSDFLLECFV